MKVFDAYLDSLFAPYPGSRRLDAARDELRTMMEDQYADLREREFAEPEAIATVIADFGSLDEIAPVLGIDREVREASARTEADAGPLRLEAAQTYAQTVRDQRPGLAAAIALYVLSPVPLLILFGLHMLGLVAETTATITGLACLLILVTVGVLLSLPRGSARTDVHDVESGRFTLTPQVRRFAEDLRWKHSRRARRALGAAVALWILAALPAVIGGLFGTGDDAMPFVGVSITLIMVALGLWIHTRESWANRVAYYLLKEQELEAAESPFAESPAGLRVAAAVYWPVATAIFLAWGFLGDFDRAWIIWPIAGVLFAALGGAAYALQKPRESART